MLTSLLGCTCGCVGPGMWGGDGGSYGYDDESAAPPEIDPSGFSIEEGPLVLKDVKRGLMTGRKWRNYYARAEYVHCSVSGAARPVAQLTAAGVLPGAGGKPSSSTSRSPTRRQPRQCTWTTRRPWSVQTTR